MATVVFEKACKKVRVEILFQLSAAAPRVFTRVTMSEAFSLDEDGAASAFNEEVAFGVLFEQLAADATASGAPATASAPFHSSVPPEIPPRGGGGRAGFRGAWPRS